MSYQSSTFDGKKHTRYTPLNEEKYIGKELPVCRSSWENTFCHWCDTNPDIVKWGSEALQIPYYDPIKKKNRRYFPDFLLRIKDKDGKETNHLVEIKPYKETIPPVITKGKSEKTIIHEATAYITNQAKWKAAITHCKKHNLEFKILTEKDLFVKGDSR